MAPDVAYEPVSVKDVLSEMKDTAELLIDLSYSAVLSGSDEVAEEVLALEERMDVLQLQARMSLLMAARSPEDAEQLAPVLGVVGAAEKIADAAGDIAKIVLEEIGLPDAMRAAIPEATEALVRATVADDADYVGRTLGAINMETERGVRAIAIRRASETGKRAWITNPDKDTELRAGDALLLRGLDEGLAAVFETATGEPYRRPQATEPSSADLERAVDSIVTMKDMSELAVDLAYGSVLFDSEAVAEEVAELEAEVDALKSRLEAWTLRAAGRVDDPVELRGLVHLAAAAETISDAALEISEGVLRGLGAHPVVAAAVEESDEVIVRLTVADDAEIADRTLGDLELATETGMRVIAIRRPGEAQSWVVSPDAATRLTAGDVLVAKGTRAGAERLSALAGDRREFDA
ncbi:phosphate transport system regulatory protein PhoU [Halolamina pelagica]|uniref:Phosphate transport system regulatory protein PhoU n=1 Tax=Halolamina pelagica TaxID=699431 RepID=A0A0P7H7H1_9EURY|nr:TrkA C-terminal domain-containing protein [Halolamina pelagica]KPN29326.1 phosphate transport system regulatory protein PhoU [Halolamina pelagica]